MFTFLARIFAGSLFKTAEGAVKSGWEWLFSSVTHLLEAALLAAIIFGLIERGHVHKAQHETQVAQQKLTDCQNARKADRVIWQQQVDDAKEATRKAQEKGQETAADVETLHTQLAQARDRFNRYVADHRVPPPTTAAPSVAPGPGSGDHSAVSPEPPTVSTVAVPSTVLDTCDHDYTYAYSAYELAQRLLKAGLAVKGTTNGN